MSTLTMQRPPLKVTQARVVKSEWIKFWSLRSTAVTLLVSVVVFIGIGLLGSAMLGGGDAQGGPGPGPDISGPVSASLAGVTLAQIAFGTLGVLFMAGEYSTGMIRSSLSAVPKRLPVLWGKIAVFTGVVFVVALAAAVIAFAGGQAIAGDAGASWSDAGVLRAVIGSAVVLTGSGVLGIGLGALLRSTPAAISTLFGVLFLLSGVLPLIVPDSWSDALAYLPSSAASSITSVTTSAGSLGPWAGLAVFLGYLVAVVAAAGWRLKHSDA